MLPVPPGRGNSFCLWDYHHCCISFRNLFLSIPFRLGVSSRTFSIVAVAMAAMVNFTLGDRPRLAVKDRQAVDVQSYSGVTVREFRQFYYNCTAASLAKCNANVLQWAALGTAGAGAPLDTGLRGGSHWTLAPRGWSGDHW